MSIELESAEAAVQQTEESVRTTLAAMQSARREWNDAIQKAKAATAAKVEELHGERWKLQHSSGWHVRRIGELERLERQAVNEGDRLIVQLDSHFKPRIEKTRAAYDAAADRRAAATYQRDAIRERLANAANENRQLPTAAQILAGAV